MPLGAAHEASIGSVELHTCVRHVWCQAARPLWIHRGCGSGCSSAVQSLSQKVQTALVLSSCHGHAHKDTGLCTMRAGTSTCMVKL